MANLENLNWKLKEQALLDAATKARATDCELEGATLMRNARHNPYSNSETPRELGGQNEPDPTLPSLNPFTQARNINGRRQSDIASELGLEVVDIIRLEQGILSEIPPKTVKYYEEYLKLPEGWQAGYRMFQTAVRRSAPRPIHGVWRFPPGVTTFQRWRTFNWPTLSQMGFCKAFCVHPSALYAIEKNARVSVPYSILIALVEANIMSQDQAKHFAYRIKQASTLEH